MFVEGVCLRARGGGVSGKAPRRSRKPLWKKDSGQNRKQTNEMICGLIEHRLSMKSFSVVAVRGEKTKRKEWRKVHNLQKKGHKRARRDTEGSCLWDKSFLIHHKGRDVSCHLTCSRNFRNDNPLRLERAAQTREEGWGELQGSIELLLVQKVKIEADKEGSHTLRARVCVVMGTQLSEEQAYFHHKVFVLVNVMHFYKLSLPHTHTTFVTTITIVP